MENRVESSAAHSLKSLIFPLCDFLCHSNTQALPGGDLKQGVGGGTSDPAEQHIFPPQAQHLTFIIGQITVVSRRLRQLKGSRLGHNERTLGCLCRAAARCRRSSVNESLALYGVEQRKWPWLLRGWPAAPQALQVNVNKLLIYGLAQE